MSAENEGQSSLEQPTETNNELQKKLRFSYTREFLLSLSELDVCKQLPGGFDPSILSEFEESSQDRQRIPGSLSLNSFRRNEYGSSPPTRGDLSSYSRGVPGRWESRSVRGDRDSDSQSDRESDSGKRYGNQPRRSWQVPEHDGLLGSGSFPRPSGYAAGASAPKFRANDSLQLNKSSEPYHPPRPYKAMPYSRRDGTDSLNDETFGSSEVTSEDRAEEERKRRASFELMRKEQHKAFQEKQKNPDKHKDQFDITTLRDDSKDEKRLLNQNKESDCAMTMKALNNDSERSSFPPQTSQSRPLVPPGFASAILERNSGTKPAIHPHTMEVANLGLENNLSNAKSNHVSDGTLDNQVEKQIAEKKVFGEFGSNKSGKNLKSSSAIDVDSQLYNTSSLSEVSESSENRELIEHNAGKVTDNEIVGASHHDNRNSILDKLFGSPLISSGAGSSSFTERTDSKVEEAWSPHAAQSSKFAHWFLEEEKKPVDDLSSSRPNDLLSLIVGGEKGGSQGSELTSTENILPSLPFESSKPKEGHTTLNVRSAVVENSEQLYKNNKSPAVAAVLTCEDLEQSILSGISESSTTLLPPVEVLSIADPKIERPKANIDDHASQHLLSLLQKGTSLKDIASSSNLDIHFPDKPQNDEEASFDTAAQTKELNADNSSNSRQSLTLETLFGTAFMKELQSVGAPVSVQRGSVGPVRGDVSEPHDFPFPVADDGNVLKSEIGLNTTSYESNVLTSNQRLQMKPVKIEEQWLGFDDHQRGLGSARLQTGLKSKLGGFDGPVDVRLPEEDSLLAAGDPLNLQNYVTAGNTARTELLPSNTEVDIAEKLAAFNIFKEERSFMGGQEGPSFPHGPYDVRELDVPYQNLAIQSSSPQLQPAHSNHGGPVLHPLDPRPGNINSQMKFMTPEGIIRHDPPNHQFPANILRPPFHHPSTGLTGFDPPSHQPLLQQMHMSGNFAPPQLLHGFPRSAPMLAQPNRGSPVPPHVNNQMASFAPELNPLQAFPFGHRQPNFAGLGMRPPAPEVGGGSNHPEAIQRLIEMELRSKSKQIPPPFPAGGHGQGIYGHELDMGFGYR